MSPTKSPSAKALVLSDYAKGVLTGGLCSSLIGLAREHAIPVIVDPKGRDFSRYAGATVITPNRAELALATDTPSQDSESLFTAAIAVRTQLNLQAVAGTANKPPRILDDPGVGHTIKAASRRPRCATTFHPGSWRPDR